MRVATSVLELIGQTPLLRLGGVEPDGGGEIWAKLEALTPGGSVKDRVGLALVRAAERSGELTPGGTVIEATAGNTGIALALAGVRLGYRVVLFVPAKYSVEKQELMKALGAEVVVTPESEGITGAQQRAADLAARTAGAVYVDQFANPANPEVHYETTGAEIWEQTGGRVDALVVGAGSGGTFTGAARYLKERRPELLAVAVEPEGSALTGDGCAPHEVEGIGMERVHPVVDRELIDRVVTVGDPECFDMVRILAARCGVLGGSSAGANVAVAVEIAAELGPGTSTVTVIPDSCERYMSKAILEMFKESA